jgi:antitoxin (DNA-binding transcriptional repressor) of toxin-antitoxin stability system
MAELGIRGLRTDLAARIRRAAVGETTVITVNGRPVAQLGPVNPAGDAGPLGLAALIASGAVLPPRRTDKQVSQHTVTVWGTVRLDRLLREIRG